MILKATEQPIDISTATGPAVLGMLVRPICNADSYVDFQVADARASAEPLADGGPLLPSEIKRRLEAAIREADEKGRAGFREARVVTPEVAQAFAPVEEAAREIEDYLRSIPGIEMTTNPDSISVKLGDLELWLSYDPSSKMYVGEESGHSWYDGERYAEHYAWPNAEECTDALIRSCAQYVRAWPAPSTSRPQQGVMRC